MTQEEKQLLLKDLCARLPYDVKVQLLDGNHIGGITTLNEPILTEIRRYNQAYFPYLRPMSSMTEEEKKEYDQLRYDPWHSHYDENICSKVLDWLNTHHFDYRGLIEMGLAIEAPEGMYNV